MSKVERAEIVPSDINTMGADIQNGSNAGAAAGGAIAEPVCGEMNSKSHSSVFLVASVFGAVVSIPLAWLLSFAALFPFLLGLFFFILFGLIVGAVTYRFASKGRPYGQATILMGTSLIVATGWALSLLKEGWDFPTDMAAETVRLSRDLGGMSAAEYRKRVASDIRTHLVERYPPGGAFGYMRWALVSGEIKKGEIPLVHRTLRREQHGVLWGVRVVLSLGLFAFGVASQTFPLRRTSDTSRSASSTES